MGFRKDRRDEKNDNLENISKTKEPKASPSSSSPASPERKNFKDSSQSGSQEISERDLQNAEQLLHQVHLAYSKYFSLQEKTPPRDLKQRLDQTMTKMDSMQKKLRTGPLQFRIQTLLSSYKTHLQVWEKKLREKEQK